MCRHGSPRGAERRQRPRHPRRGGSIRAGGLPQITWLLISLGLAGSATADPPDTAPPSLELLEYLAEYVETEDGGLLDPLEAIDSVTAATGDETDTLGAYE